ncbi:MAG: cold shock domain-containing protein [Thermomonas sp.]
MRTHGTLAKWNDDRGFGFISPAGGGAELFVHVSAFPRDGRRPTVGEVVSYEIEKGADGKTRAVGVIRPGQKAQPRPAYRAAREKQPKPAGIIEAVIAVLLIGGIARYAYTRMHKPESPSPPAVQISDAQKIRASFACENPKACPQMHSCEEARQYLKTCPNAPMDGDEDGIPCEEQWCTAGAD